MTLFINRSTDVSKIKVTAQQRANAIEARDVMWPSVPPENVYQELANWNADTDASGARARKIATCGTVACFGGWCAYWPPFQAQGVRLDLFTGAPQVRPRSNSDLIPIQSASKYLFGVAGLFAVRDHGDMVDHKAPVGVSDHELVTHRLNWLIKNSVVVK